MCHIYHTIWQLYNQFISNKKLLNLISHLIFCIIIFINIKYIYLLADPDVLRSFQALELRLQIHRFVNLKKKSSEATGNSYRLLMVYSKICVYITWRYVGSALIHSSKIVLTIFVTKNDKRNKQLHHYKQLLH